MSTDVVLVGHPFSSIGMGEQLRAGFNAVRAAGVSAKLFDIYRYAPRSDEDFRDLVFPNESVGIESNNVRIFHINGDEVDGVLKALEDRGQDFKAGYNIIVPAWELPRYPDVWVKQVKLFDEVWAISRFVSASLSSAKIPNFHVGQSIEKDLGPLLSRRYFGIRESSFAMLHFYDSKSYPARKNPEAVVQLYNKLRKSRPFDDFQLVLKARAGDADAEQMADELAAQLPRDVRVITQNLTSHEALSLVACCDCFVSLHRSEGFGRGLAEAMGFGKLALGTGWSGNCDYMDEKNSLFVNYELIDVAENAYPCWEGQQWANPDLDHAAYLLTKAMDSSAFRSETAALGRASAMRNCSNRAVGVRMLARLRALREGLVVQ